MPNAVDVCSYCNTAVFARALNSAMHGELLAAEEQGRQELEIKRQRDEESSHRQWAERRQRTITLSVAGIAVGVVVLIVVIQWARQFSGWQITIGVIVILMVVGVIGGIAEELS